MPESVPFFHCFENFKIREILAKKWPKILTKLLLLLLGCSAAEKVATFAEFDQTLVEISVECAFDLAFLLI